MWILTTIACSWLDADPSFLDARPKPVRPGPAAPTMALSLSRIPPTSVQVPPSSRPGGEAAPDRIRLLGSFAHVETRGQTEIWGIPLPIQSGQLPAKDPGALFIGNHALPGLQVIGTDGPLGFHRRAGRPGTWGNDRDRLYIGIAAGTGPPDPAAYTLRFPRATSYEDGLNLTTSGLPATDFVARTATVDTTSRLGMLVPAPGEITWDVTIPDGGHLTFDALILPPAIALAEVSDGATVQVEIRVADAPPTVLGTVDAHLRTPTAGRFDLSSYAGRSVTLVLSTDPGPSPILDYVFVAAPVIAAPDPSPDRVLLLFVDTLRPDHLGMYGYSRPTSPMLDRWGAGAAVFSNARTVAPWTLPSARSVLSGVQPEHYADVPALQERLGERGFRTEGLVSNAFLSQPFGLHLGWDRYTYGHLADASWLVDEAERILDAHADRDLLLMVHFMEPHLPYREPARLRSLFAGPPPAQMPGMSRYELSKISPDDPHLDAYRDHLVDRYDQNIRAVDDALLPLLEAIGPDATVVLFSDHGEEFWEHDGFEHGHSFHEEVMRTVLAVRSPGLPPGRLDADVSLMDVTPTVLDLLGISAPGLSGRSLVPLGWGDAGAAATLATRPLAFGRPLYGDDGWGVVHRGHKWWDRSGVEQLYDLEADPQERTDRASDLDRDPYPEALSAALDRPVPLVWRVSLGGMVWPDDVTVTMSHPDGIAAAWLGYAPRATVRPEPTLVDGRAQVVVPGGESPPPLVYLHPKGDPLSPDGLAISFVGRKLSGGAMVEGRGTVTPGPGRTLLLRAGDPNYHAIVDLAWVPVTSGEAVRALGPGVEDQLRELGYLDDQEVP